MTRQPENKIETAFVQWCDDNYIEAAKLAETGRRGWPDRSVLLGDGRVVLIEFKRPGGRLSGLQKRKIDALRRSGYEVLVTDDTDKAVRFVEERLTTSFSDRRARHWVKDGKE